MIGKDRCALVTGASRGIGRGVACALAEAGVRTLVTARSLDALDPLASQYPSGQVVGFACDLSRPEDAENLAEWTLQVSGGVDILVNNAGMLRTGPVERLTAAKLQAGFSTNVVSSLLLIARLVPTMAERGGGSIVNISSIHGTVGIPKSALYAATKGAIEASTRSLAIELGGRNIRVNAVAPGAIRTAMWRELEARGADTAPVLAQTALARWGEVSDVVEAVMYLLSPAASYVTGHTLFVDGGLGRLVHLLPQD